MGAELAASSVEVAALSPLQATKLRVKMLNRTLKGRISKKSPHMSCHPLSRKAWFACFPHTLYQAKTLALHWEWTHP